jgi:hypothetical protein
VWWISLNRPLRTKTEQSCGMTPFLIPQSSRKPICGMVRDGVRESHPAKAVRDEHSLTPQSSRKTPSRRSLLILAPPALRPRDSQLAREIVTDRYQPRGGPAKIDHPGAMAGAIYVAARSQRQRPLAIVAPCSAAANRACAALLRGCLKPADAARPSVLAAVYSTGRGPPRRPPPLAAPR